MKNNIKVLCVTGPIGSGKSTVADFFGKTYGIPIYYADHEAKKAYFDILIKPQIEALLGKEVYRDGLPDYKLIGEKVFPRPTILKKLENLIHPFVYEDFKNWLKRQCMPYVILENALLPASEFKFFCDETIVMQLPQEEQINRIVKRDGLSRKAILDRLARQTGLDYRSINARWYLENLQSFKKLIPILHEIHRFMVKK